MARKISRPKINASATASIWYIASNFISRGTVFIFTPIFTRLLAPEEFGIYSLYTGLMGIFTVITTLEMSGGVMYRGLAKFDGEGRDGFISSALGAQIALSSLALIFYIIFRRAVNATTSLTTPLTLILIIQVFINSVEGIYFAKKRYAGDYRAVSFINIASGLITPTLALFMIKSGVGGAARIVAPFLVSLTVSIPIAIGLLKKERKLFSRKFWKFIFGFTLPMLPHYLSLSVIAQSEKIIIARLLGDGALGRYSAAYSTGFVISLVSTGLTLALTPWIMRKLNAAKFDTVSAALTRCVRVLCLLTLLYLSVIPEVFSVIAPSEYYEALPVTYIISVSVIFSFSSASLTSCLLHYEKPTLITRNSVISATVALISGIFLIRQLGYIGGAIVPLISYILLFTLNSATVRRVGGKDMINAKQCLQTVFISFGFTVLLFMLRGSMAARAVIFFALVLMLLPELKRCKKMLF